MQLNKIYNLHLSIMFKQLMHGKETSAVKKKQTQSSNQFVWNGSILLLIKYQVFFSRD